jgi:hypothetical protein
MMQSNILSIADSNLQSQMDRWMGGVGAVPCVTTLNRQPTNIFIVGEYEHGIAGRKAARLYKRGERRVKAQVLSKKVGLNCIATLVRAVFTAQAAIDRIYQVYGENATRQQSLTG